jgi:hypothetical protein
MTNAFYVAPTLLSPPSPSQDSTNEVIGALIENYEENANDHPKVEKLGPEFKDQVRSVDPDARKKKVTRPQHITDPPALLQPF